VRALNVTKKRRRFSLQLRTRGANYWVLSRAVANVLIAGCGYVGAALGLELLAAGERVWGARRNVSLLPGGIEPIAADLSDPGSLTQLPVAPDYLVYCASADESTDAAYLRAYVQGLRNVLAAVDGSRLQRVFFTSSTAVYAQHAGEWVDEASETTPTHFSGTRTLEAEHLLREQAIPATVLRCSGIYGPGRTRLIDSVRQGTAKASERYTNRIHRDDIAGAIVHLLRRSNVPPLLLLSDDEPAPERDVTAYLAAQLGVAEPPPAPAAPPARGGHKRCRNTLLKATGYRLRYPTYREGYSAMLGSVSRG
jgi:nucleoside-diphosphate-sugar epimerase